MGPLIPPFRSMSSPKVSRLFAGTLLLGSLSLEGAMLFTDVTPDANILHTHSHVGDAGYFEAGEPFGLDYAQLTGGAVAEDFDGDGWIDLYVLQGGDSANLLYINQRDGTFTDEAQARGVDLVGAQMGVAAADFDSDGDVDIFISAAVAPHILLINDGTGSFQTDTQVFSLPATRATSPSWGDIDNDGLLDLALGAWISGRGNNTENYIQIYRNEGGGQLEPYLSLPNNWDYIPRFLDYDNDRYQDLLVVADFGQARWFRNSTDGLFLPDGSSDIENGMGGAVGDIDSDGDLDIFMTAIRYFNPGTGEWVGTGNRLLLNDGAGGFDDITETAGLRDGAWGWGSEFSDFDNDGDLDLYHVNGWSLDAPVGTLNLNDGNPARLFENNGDNTFSEVAALAGDADDIGQGRTVVVFDYDNDGDQDIFIGNNSVPSGSGTNLSHAPARPTLLRNDSANTNAYLSVSLSGLERPHHSQGIGARVYARVDGFEQMRELHASSGFNGHGTGRIAHFGLGDTGEVDELRAVWTNGDETIVRAVGVNQALVLESPKAQVSKRVVDPGEAFEFSYLLADLPLGAGVEWSIDGEVLQGSGASLNEAGVHYLVATIRAGGGTGAVLSIERLSIRVRSTVGEERSVARLWNEQNLSAIRIDFPDPTTHARNLFGSSVAMWDAWAAYEDLAVGVFHNEDALAGDVEAARREAISFAAYRVLSARYAAAVNGSTTLLSLRFLMEDLGYDPNFVDTLGSSPAALGNRVAESVLGFMDSDGWDDRDGFFDGAYVPQNDPLPLAESGAVMNEPNRWQPLLFEIAFTQNEQTADLVQSILGSHWGGVRPFALSSLSESEWLHLDPGPPPLLGGATDLEFKDGNVLVIEYSSLLDPTQSNDIDISPGAMGNNSLGANDGLGYLENPSTRAPYVSNTVKHADFGRVLAEFWADGPESETPPGHWNVLANELHEHPDFVRKFTGIGSELDLLEWDVKTYLALNGALHDAAIAAWGVKRIYDYVRPISSIRYMGGKGQSSDSLAPAYHPEGLPLVEGLIEQVTSSSSATGMHHEHLAANIGEIAIRTWSAGPEGGAGKVDWILAVDWLPYQRDTFVTPAFPGYVSGHSTFSRAAAEVLTQMTGDAFFPGGLGEFVALKDEYLKFEPGPSSDIRLQWGTYFDAADQAGLSRLYGGIHVPADDGPGRIIGSICGITAWDLATDYFDGSIGDEPIWVELSKADETGLEFEWNTQRGAYYKVQGGSRPEAVFFSDLTDWTQAGETSDTMTVPNDDVSQEPIYLQVIRSYESP